MQVSLHAYGKRHLKAVLAAGANLRQHVFGNARTQRQLERADQIALVHLLTFFGQLAPRQLHSLGYPWVILSLMRLASWMFWPEVVPMVVASLKPRLAFGMARCPP